MSEVESAIEFYDDICKDIAKSNLESLIEGFEGFKSPALANACKWTNVAVSGLENADSFATMLTTYQKYSNEKDEQMKRNIAAQNLSATLKVVV